jgi:hypothetical protein
MFATTAPLHSDTWARLGGVCGDGGRERYQSPPDYGGLSRVSAVTGLRSSVM